MAYVLVCGLRRLGLKSTEMAQAQVSTIRTRLLTRRRNGGPEQAQSASLTDRERFVLKLLAEGRSVKQVATELNLSVKIVQTHTTNMMRKLDIHSRSQLVQYAVQHKSFRSI